MTWREELDSYVEWLGGRDEPASESYRNSVKSVGKRLATRFELGSFLDLSGEEMFTWVKELREKGLSKASVKAYRAQVKALARWVNGGEIPTAYRGGSTKTPSRVRSREDLLSDKDLESLVAHLNPRDAMASLLMRYTGARPGEVLGLRRGNVEFVTKEGRTFALLNFVDTKTDVDRAAALADAATIGTLQRYLEFLKTDLLFPAPRNLGVRLSAQTFWVSLSRAVKKAGIRTRVYPYLFRHTFATREGAKMGSAARARQMGTKSETVLEHYDHVSGEDLVELLAGMEGTGRPEAQPEAIARLEVRLDQVERFSVALLTVLEHLSKRDPDVRGLLDTAKIAFDRAGRAEWMTEPIEGLPSGE